MPCVWDVRELTSNDTKSEIAAATESNCASVDANAWVPTNCGSAHSDGTPVTPRGA
jgi:hypothetical protein